ncbi:hypothetical protein ACC739_28180, partial [Rhizobium ruizarguesonis]
SAQFRTQNRCALLLELLCLLFCAIPDAKPLCTFAGIALSFVLRNSERKTAVHFCWNCSVFCSAQFRTQNRCALLLELL